MEQQECKPWKARWSRIKEVFSCLFWVLLILCMIVVVIIEYNKAPAGTTCTTTVKLYAPLSNEVMDEYFRAKDLGDFIGVQKLIDSGLMLPIQAGTRVLVLKTNIGYFYWRTRRGAADSLLFPRQVRILEGENRGKIVRLTNGQLQRLP